MLMLSDMTWTTQPNHMERARVISMVCMKIIANAALLAWLFLQLDAQHVFLGNALGIAASCGYGGSGLQPSAGCSRQ